MYGGWAPYVSVAERRAKTKKLILKMQKKGAVFNPVENIGRVIAKTFWGKSWCTNLESYSDYESRLPRGRTYVRNGSVIDLKILPGSIQAQVMGSDLYQISITMTSMPDDKWQSLVSECSGQIDSVVELLQGKFSKSVMSIMTESSQGLFPKPSEIKFSCSCPDWAGMCKHIAAVMYGIGARLDEQPEFLFTLRQVDHLDLIKKAAIFDNLPGAESQESAIEEEDLSALFGIEISSESEKPKELKKQNPVQDKIKTKTKTKSEKPEKEPDSKLKSKKKTLAKKTKNV